VEIELGIPGPFVPAYSSNGGRRISISSSSRQVRGPEVHEVRYDAHGDGLTTELEAIPQEPGTSSQRRVAVIGYIANICGTSMRQRLGTVLQSERLLAPPAGFQ
jgi:hypothetical protein